MNPQHVSSRLPLLLLGFCLAASSAVAHADTVQSTAVIYAAGTQSGVAAAVGGTLPDAVSITPGTTAYTFSTTGTITLNNGTGNNLNDADGAHAAVTSSFNTGTGSLSGITGPGAGYLTGVFVAAGGPTGAAPASLNFTSTGMGSSFASLNPLLDQVFFIGDGLTGDGTGSVQTFYVPTGAATLYLGISDAPGYNGGPGAYGDNVGSYTVAVNRIGGAAPTPEPSSLALLGTGLLGITAAVRRRFTRL